MTGNELKKEVCNTDGYDLFEKDSGKGNAILNDCFFYGQQVRWKFKLIVEPNFIWYEINAFAFNIYSSSV